MNRVRPPNRRLAEIIDFEHAGRRFAGFARFANGRLGELLIDPPKESPLGDSVCFGVEEWV